MGNPKTRSLITSVYRDLGYAFAEGRSLFDATNNPAELPQDVWIDKGDWITSAHHAGAEKVFFLDSNPVVVFAKIDTEDSEKIRKLYNRAWSMVRPRLLFLATPAKFQCMIWQRNRRNQHRSLRI